MCVEVINSLQESILSFLCGGIRFWNKDLFTTQSHLSHSYSLLDGIRCSFCLQINLVKIDNVNPVVSVAHSLGSLLPF